MTLADQLVGIPEKIVRQDVWEFIEGLGINVNHCQSLVIHVSSIEAVVLALNDEGHFYCDKQTGDIAVHRISIPMVERPAGS